jgi:hypothetical protein
MGRRRPGWKLSNTLGVMPGFDPGIHTDAQRKIDLRFCPWLGIMDRRVKPGDDGSGRCRVTHHQRRRYDRD